MKARKLCSQVHLLNYHAPSSVNFDVIRAMILKQAEPVDIVHKERKIKRKRKAGGTVAILTEPDDKKYRINFFKSRRMHDHSYVPFVYK